MVRLLTRWYESTDRAIAVTTASASTSLLQKFLVKVFKSLLSLEPVDGTS